MQTNIIRRIVLFAVLLSLPILITKCKITDFIMSRITEISSYPCRWPDWANVYFLDPELQLPGDTCTVQFNNAELSTSYPAYSFYELMMANAYTANPSYELIWTASIIDKPCDDSWNSEESKQIIFTQDDFWGRLFHSTCDWIEYAPLVEFSENINTSNVKHSLVFKLLNVTNSIDGSTGYITWEKTWIGENHASFDNYPLNKWEFDFSSAPMVGTFHSEDRDHRQIYVHNQYNFY